MGTNSAILTAFANNNVDLENGPPDAIVIRGYRTDVTVPAAFATVLTTLSAATKIDDATKTKLETAIAPKGFKRLYLSAHFDRYVDYHTDDQLAEVYPDPPDDTVIVWIRRRGKTNPNPLRLVTSVPLESAGGFIRGQFVEDFLAQPEAQSIWDEQNYATGKPRSTGNCFR